MVYGLFYNKKTHYDVHVLCFRHKNPWAVLVFNCLLNARFRRRGEMHIPTLIHASNQHMSAKLVLLPAPLTFFSGCYGLKPC